MMRSRLGLLFAIFVLSGCDHHKQVNPAQTESGNAAVAQTPGAQTPGAQTPVGQTDSDLTGEPPSAAGSSAPPSYPRATLVSLPPSSPSPTSNPAPANTAAASPSETNPAPAPVTTQLDTASSAPATMPAGSPDSNPSPDASAAPAPSSEAHSDMTRLAMNSPSPVVATTPPPALDNAESRKQVVVLETSLGRVVIELDDVSAPLTCGNFRKLVNDGFYNHTTFHRVIPNFMIQGGDPNSKSDDRATYGQGDPGYTLPAEIKLNHDAGAVAMARLPDSANPQRDSNGSQFFICVAACPSLDGQYTVFGHVIKGMDTAIKIASQPRDQRDDPATRIEMEARLEPKKQAMEEDSSAK
jgi:cyclophilin family peptidyl-prolyl cis-trans isomerase